MAKRTTTEKLKICRPVSFNNCQAEICQTVVTVKFNQHVSEAFESSEIVGLGFSDVKNAFVAVYRLGLIHYLK